MSVVKVITLLANSAVYKSSSDVNFKPLKQLTNMKFELKMYSPNI